KPVQSRIPQPRFDERLHLRIGNALVVHEGADRTLKPRVGQFLDVCRSSPEAGMRQQVRGAVVVPVGRCNGCQVVLPDHRSRGPTNASDHRALQEAQYWVARSLGAPGHSTGYLLNLITTKAFMKV